MKNGEAEGREPVTAIVLHRALRQLIGPTGTVVDLPWLTMQLLIALHDHAPQFVDARRLQELVWPDTHISPDALKQRVRLARQALREAGYDPALLDSVRGEGYALRVPLAEPAIGHAPPSAAGDMAPTHTEAADQPGLSPGMTQHASHVSSTYQSSWWRRWRIAIMAALIFSAALIAERLGQWGGSTRTVDAPANAVIGPAPVRVALLRDTATDSLVSRALEAVLQSARRTLAAHADVLLVPRPAGASCTDGPPVHLCAHIAGNAQEVRLDVTDLRSGTALVLGSWPLSASEGDVLAGSAEAAQLAVLVSPGTLRWIGEPAGRGDREFGTLLRAVKASTSCDRVAWRDAVRDLGTTAERAPQFHVARALRALLAVASTDLPEQIPTALLANVEQLLRVDPEQMLAQAARWLAAVRQLPPSEVSTAGEAELSAEFRRIKRQSPGVAWLAEHLRSCSLKAAVTRPGDPE